MRGRAGGGSGLCRNGSQERCGGPSVTHLHEIGRLTVPADAIVSHVTTRLDVAAEDLKADDASHH